MNRSKYFQINSSFRLLVLKTRTRFYEASQVLGYSVLLSHLTFIPYVHANPAGGEVVGGNGTITHSDLSTVINQTSANMAINWDSYNVQANERVQYIQPDINSVSLNRILSSGGSEIHGRIDANGQVILVNPHGIFFGAGSQINVGGMVASGLDIKPADFMNGDYIFNEVLGTDGTVINSGMLSASLGGSITLLGKQLKNEGVINARLGAVNMAAGKQAILTFDPQGLMGVRITKAIVQDELGIDPALINSGEINAESGRVLLTASVSRDVFSQAVNTGDILPATSVVMNEDGSYSLGGGADAINSGSISVSSTDQNDAGSVVMLGENLTHTGTITADSESSQAGEVELHSRHITELQDSALVSAQAKQSGKGGKVKVLGNKIGLLDQSTINVSGVNGGGEVLLGGDREGKNTWVPNADFVYLGNESKIFADALTNGNGGKIITFAEDTGRFFGGLYARGGAEGGDGGFIETSGLRGFEIGQAPDVSSSAGSGGLWLIDPYNITISDSDVNSAATGENPTIYEPGAIGSFISTDTIRTGLSNGSVEIKTINDGTHGADESAIDPETGNIFFDAILNYENRGDFNSTGENTFTLNAEGNISFFLGSKIYDSKTDDTDSLNVQLFSKGMISFNNAIIYTNGGDFIVGGDGGNTATSFVSSASSLIDTSGREDVSGGNINILTTGALSTGKLITDGGSVSSDNDGTSAGTITLNGNDDVNVQNLISAMGKNGVLGSGWGGSPPARAGGSGGDVLITSQTGNVTIANTINTNGGDAVKGSSTGKNGGNAGTVEINATTATKTISLANNITTHYGKSVNSGSNGTAGSVNIKGDVILAGDVSIDTNRAASVDAAEPSALIKIDGTVNADSASLDRTLTLDAGNSTVDITKGVGQLVDAALAGFVITESGATSIGAIKTGAGGIAINNTAAINLGGSLDTTAAGATAGSILLDGDITLLADAVLINTNGTGSGTGNDKAITINGTVNADSFIANRSLELNAGDNAVSLANVGDKFALQVLKVTNSLSTSLNQVNTKDGGVDITASSTNTDAITLNNNITTNFDELGGNTGNGGAVSLTGNTQIANSLTINTASASTDVSATDGKITIGTLGTAFSSNELTLNAGKAAVELKAVADATTALHAFKVTSAGSINIAGDIYTGSGGVSLTTTTLLNGTVTPTGDINITDGSTGVGHINTSNSATNDGGNITIVSAGSVSAGNLTSSGGAVDTNANAIGTSAGDVKVWSENSITLGDINSLGQDGNRDSGSSTGYAGGDGGLVNILSFKSNGDPTTKVANSSNINIGSITTNGGDADARSNGSGQANGGDAGSVLIASHATDAVTTLAGDITVHHGDRFVGSDVNTVTATDGSANSITINTDVLLAADIALDTNKNNDQVSPSGLITIDGKVNSATLTSDTVSTTRSLTIDAGSQNVTISGDAGVDKALSYLYVLNSNTTDLQSVTTTVSGANLYGIDISNTGKILLGGNLTSAAGIHLSGDINVGASTAEGVIVKDNITLTANKDQTTTNAIILDSDINADLAATNSALTFVAGSGNVNVQNVGNIEAVDSFSVISSANTRVASITTNGGVVSITANDNDANTTDIQLFGNITTATDTEAGNVSLIGSAIANNTMNINTNSANGIDGDITTGEILSSDNANQLTFDAGNGAVDVQGGIGSNTTHFNLFDITSAGSINIGGNIQAGSGGVSLLTTRALNGTLTPTGDINITDGSSGAGHIITSNTAGDIGGDIILNSAGAVSVGDLTADGGAVSNSSNSVGTNAGKIKVWAEDQIDLGDISAKGQNANRQNGSDNGFIGGNGGSVDILSFASNGDTTAKAANSSDISVGSITVTGGDATGEGNGSGQDNGGNAGSVLIASHATDAVTTLAGDITVHHGDRFVGSNVNTVTATDGSANSITINTDVLLAANIALDTNKNNDQVSPSGLITIDGKVNSATLTTDTVTTTRGLTIDAGSRNVSITGDAGVDKALSYLYVLNSNTTDLQSVTTTVSGANLYGIDIANTRKILLGGNLTSGAGIHLSGDINVGASTAEGVIVKDNTILTANKDQTTTNAIILDSDINADPAATNSALTFVAGSGNVNVQNVGNIEAVDSFTVSSSANTRVGSITTSGGVVNITANDNDANTSDIQLFGNITTATDAEAGNVTLNGAAIVNNAIQIDTNSANGIDGFIKFTDSIQSNSGSNTLLLDAGTAYVEIQGDVGTGGADAHFNTFTISSSDNVKVGAIQAGGGGVSISTTDNAGNIQLSGNIHTDNDADAGAITLNGNLLLNADVILDTDGNATDSSNIAIAGTINSLTAATARSIEFQADEGNVSVGADTGEGNEVSAFTVTSSTDTSVAAINTRGGNVTINATTTSLAGNIDTVDSTDALANAGNLLVGGDVTLKNSVSITTAVADIAAIDGSVEFTGNINDDSQTTEVSGLSINAGSNTVKLKDVGATEEIASLTILDSLTTEVGEIKTNGGNVTIKASSTLIPGIYLDGDINTTLNAINAGLVSLTGKTQINNNVTITTNVAGSGTDGAISFSDNITTDNISNELVLNAGAEAVDINGNVGVSGGAGHLNKFNITNSSSVKMGEIQAGNGGVSITTTDNAGDIQLSGNIHTDNDNQAGAIILNGNLLLNANVVLDSDGTNTDSSNITIAGSINSLNSNAHSIQFTADKGDVSVGGDTGLINNVQSFVVNSSDNTTVDAISTSGGSAGVVTINADTLTQLGGNIDTTKSGNSISAGAVTINSAVDLNTDVTIRVDSGNSIDANVAITGDVNTDVISNTQGNAYQFIVDAGAGNVDLQSVGADRAVTGITVTDSSITNIGEIGTAGGNVDITATNQSVLSGNIATNKNSVAVSGDVLMKGPVTLASDVNIDTRASITDGMISFSNTVDADANVSDGAESLAIYTGDADVVFNEDVGRKQALQKLTIVSAQNSSNKVTLQNVETTNGGNDNTERGVDITASAIDLFGSINTASGLTDAGNVNLDVNDGVIKLFDHTRIMTKGSTASGSITITGNVVANTNHDLRLIAGTTDDSNITINGDMGLAAEMGSLSSFEIVEANNVSIDGVNTNAGDVVVHSRTIGLGGDINTTFAGSSSGRVELLGLDNLTPNAITLENDASIITDAASGTDAEITLDRVDGGFDFLLNSGAADTVFNKDIGGIIALNSLKVQDSRNTFINGNIITKTDTLDVVSSVEIKANNQIFLNGDIDTSTSTTVSHVMLDGPLRVAGARMINTNSDINGNVTFTGTVDSHIDAQSARGSLVIDAGTTGDVEFQKQVGSLETLDSLSILNADQLRFIDQLTTQANIDINANLVEIGGNFTIAENGAINIAGSQAGDVVLTNNVILDSNGQSAAGEINIKGVINSTANNHYGLIIDSGDANVSLNSNIGDTQALAKLLINNNTNSQGVVSLNGVKTTADVSENGNGDIRVSAGQINLNGALDTTNGFASTNAGAIALSGPVSLKNDVQVTTDSFAGTDGLIVFNDRVTGSETTSLIVDAGSANVNFLADVTDIESLFINNGQTVTDSGNVSVRNIHTASNVSGVGVNITGKQINVSGDGLNNTVIKTNLADKAGSITLNGQLVLDNTLALDSKGNLGDANITIDGDILTKVAASVHQLLFTAGEGNVDVMGKVGSVTNSLGGVEVVSANVASFDELNLQNNGLNITATQSDLGGNINTTYGVVAGAVNISGDVILSSNVAINAGSAASATGDVLIDGSLNTDSSGSYNFVVENGAADITLTNAAGTAVSGEIGKLDLATTGTINVSAIESVGPSVSLKAGVVNLSGNILADQADSAGSVLVSANQFNLLSDVLIDTNSINDDFISITASDIQANGNSLTLDSGDNLTSVSSQINNLSSFEVVESSFTSLKGVQVNDAGDINVKASNGISASGDYTTISGSILLNADSDGNGSGTLTLENPTNVRTMDNLISLTAASLDGTGVSIDSGAAGQVDIISTTNLSLGSTASGVHLNNDLMNSLVANTVNLVSANDVLIDGANINRDIDLQVANGSIAISGADSTLGGLHATALNSISIGSNLSTNNAINLSASNITANAQGSLTSTTADITLNGTVSGNNTLDLRAQQGTVDLVSATLSSLDSLSVDANNLLLAASTPVSTTNNININIRGSSPYTQAVDLNSTQGQVALSTNGNLVMAAGVSINAQDAVNLTSATGNINLTRVNVNSGNININANNGAVIDNNGTAENLIANRVNIRANNGIGSNDSLETRTSVLDVINNGAGGSKVNIINSGSVLLTHLVNKGDIAFENIGNVNIDNLNAGFDTGSLEMKVFEGSVYGIDRGSNNTSVPDITANIADIGVDGEFGTADRPIVLKIKSEFYLFSSISSSLFLGAPPPINIDDSQLQVNLFDSANSATGNQLIEVESTADIDPAIFTQLRNYSMEEIALQMPRDQLFEDELEEELALENLKQ